MPSSSATRKVWVRRPGASATLVAFGENNVVDDVRETLLHKYGNSLGRVYDAPDITLRLIPRADHPNERILGPDESMEKILAQYYPGGQTIEEALIIDVPLRRTPTSSPRGGPPVVSNIYRDGHVRGYEPQSDYFGPSAGNTPSTHSHSHQHSHHLHATHSGFHLHASTAGGGGGSGNMSSSMVAANGGVTGSTGTNSPHHHPHSIAILSTGQIAPIPNLPSPGGARRMHKDRSERPKLNRQHSANSGGDGVGGIRDYANQSGASYSLMSDPGGGAVANSSMSSNAGQITQGSMTPKISIAAPVGISANGGYGNGIDGGSLSGGGGAVADKGVDGDVSLSTNGIGGGNNPKTSSGLWNGAPPPRPSSPFRVKKTKKNSRTLDDGRSEFQLGPLTVPPINVLIVEDNIINLKLLEAFVKRLKVRWQTAMNGRDAVLKWRTGGFHLVLMDIQLPLMSGLEATREIRRLERVNSIGVFASTPSDSIGNGRDPRSDKLENMSLFKSPVIIVALTASSLQSDRNDALAAGCNDFLTKPVNFVWLEKKIMEWGCMQALIDFDGWRKWKELKLPSLTPAEADNAAEHEKKAKKHAKRPSLVSTNHEAGDSSDTIATISPAEAVQTIMPRSTDAKSSGSGSGSGSIGRSPLSISGEAERLRTQPRSPLTGPVSREAGASSLQQDGISLPPDMSGEVATVTA